SSDSLLVQHLGVRRRGGGLREGRMDSGAITIVSGTRGYLCVRGRTQRSLIIHLQSFGIFGAVAALVWTLDAILR
ncbi:hypothetical protein, partial [Rhodococcus aetherivorans]|uniref:hypothetical protein n=1 Tax=Rhodococcus aetherivorans TaxID=191292 RepID=UPI001C86DB76